MDGDGPVYGDPLPSEVLAVETALKKSDEEGELDAGTDGFTRRSLEVKEEELTHQTVQAKTDTMNGGEWNRDVSCYAQMTPLHAQRAQQWAAEAPLPLSVDGVPAIYVWHEESHS